MLNRAKFVPLASIALAVASFGAPSRAHALTAVTPSNLTTLSADSVSSLIKTVGIGADHHAYAPATALGVMFGLDVGADVTYLGFPADFVTALSAASGQSSASLPSGVPLPKVNIHKGLPFGIDVGGSFMSYSSGGSKVFSSYAGELKYAFIDSASLPAVAARASYSVNSVYFLEASTFALDAVVSKNLVLIDPYLGAGLRRYSGKINVSADIPVPSGISLEASGTAFHAYGGLQLKLAIMRIVAEADYSSTGLTTFGGKFSFGF